MKTNYAKKADNSSSQAAGSFSAHNFASASASVPEYEWAEDTCALINNEKDTSFAVSFSLIALFAFIYLIAIPIFGVALVLNPLLVLGGILAFHRIMLYMIKSKGLYRN